MSELTLPEERERAPAQTMTLAVAEAVREIMTPMLYTLNAMAAQMEAQNRRMEALEKEVRWMTPVSAKQCQLLNAEIRKRAGELAAAIGTEDREKKNQIARAIRKSVCVRWGVGKISEVPKGEYQVAMRLVDDWKEWTTLKKILREG